MNDRLRGYFKGYMEKRAADPAPEKSTGVVQKTKDYIQGLGKSLYKATDAAPAQKLLPILTALAAGGVGSQLTEDPMVGGGIGAALGALGGAQVSEGVDNALTPYLGTPEGAGSMSDAGKGNWEKLTPAQKTMWRKFLLNTDKYKSPLKAGVSEDKHKDLDTLSGKLRMLTNGGADTPLAE